MPQVSVVVPVYNIEAHLRQCLDSVAGQTLSDLEIICVDDGSTDASPAILGEYARRDPRFRVVRQANAGPGVARNRGMELVTGEYLIFLDSDDWFEPDFLERMAVRAEETGADVTICRGVEFDAYTGKELPSEWMLKTVYLPDRKVFAPGDVAEHLFQFTYGMPWDKLYRREYIQEIGVRFPSLYNSEDLAFVFPTLVSAAQISVLDEVHIHHRVNRRASVSNTREWQPRAPYDAFQMVKAYLEKYGLMARYEKSFLNWAMEFLVWHVSNMGDGIIRRRYLQTLRQVWLPEIRFGEHPPSYYENKANYAKYLLAKYAPYHLFSAVVVAYKWGKRLVSFS